MIFVCFLTFVFSSMELRDHCELVELNSFHDCNARHVFDQVIFYEWAPDQARYHVRAWCISEDRDFVSRRPAKRYSDGLHVVQWQDNGVDRVITADHYRRSASQIDPERANKKLLDESLRYGFTKRTIEKVESIADEDSSCLE